MSHGVGTRADEGSLMLADWRRSTRDVDGHLVVLDHRVAQEVRRDLVQLREDVIVDFPVDVDHELFALANVHDAGQSNAAEGPLDCATLLQAAWSRSRC